MTTRKKDYSSKLPMKAMRVMAGHDVDRDSYKILRNSVEPGEDLIDQVFPFVKEALSKINFEQTTALSTLSWLQMVARIVLQDAACMMLSGRTHCIFQFPVFRTPEFKAFLHKMKTTIDAQVTTAKTDINKCLPGVLERIDGIQSTQNEIKTDISELKEDIKKGNEEGLKQTHVRQLFDHFSEFRFDQNRPETQETRPVEQTQNISTQVPPTDVVPKYDINCNHICVSTIIEEWYGLGSYTKENTNLTADGGLEMLERKYKHTWRKHFSSKQAKVLSRIKNTIKNIKKLSQISGKSFETVVQHLVVFLADNHRHNLSAISDHIRDNLDKIVSTLNQPLIT